MTKAVDVLSDLTAQRLRSLLTYDPDAGTFTWRVDRGGGARHGDIAGSSDQTGYVRIWIDRNRYLAHRLAWLYVHGEWPKHHLDHKNRDRSDNRISNLRQASPTQNAINRKLPQGVHPVGNRFQARISVDGDRRHLGCFSTPEAAHAAYVAALRDLHGEFAPIYEDT